MRGVAVMMAVVLCTLALSDCAGPPVRFSKVGATQQVFMQDRYVCIQQSQQERGAANNYGAWKGVIVNRGVFMSCMGAKGYTLNEHGNLVATPGTEIQVVD